jgi:hypothetical protein
MEKSDGNMSVHDKFNTETSDELIKQCKAFETGET